jgi:hypothetical protein
VADEMIAAELDPKDFKRFMAEIKDFDPALARALRKNLRKIGGEMADKMKTEVKQPPPQQGGGLRRKRDGGKARGAHNSRQETAAGIGVAVATAKKRQGVFVTGSAKKLDADRKAFPRAYNKKSWRRRVFGTNTWVKQNGNPYFGKSIGAVEPRIPTAIEAALAEAAQTVRSGTTR